MIHIKKFNESQTSDKEVIENDLKDLLLDIEDKDLLTSIYMNDYPYLIYVRIKSNEFHHAYAEEITFNLFSISEELLRITDYLLLNGFTLRKTCIHSMDKGYSNYLLFPNKLIKENTNEVIFFYSKIN